MKNIVLIFVIFLTNFMGAQEKFLTKTGTVIFEASVPSFEEVKAKNESATAILNTETGEFAALVLVKGFRFKNALMEEHFNENYAESDEFPKATFKGKIIGFSKENLETSTKSFPYEGTLSFHGKTNVLKNVTLNMALNSDGSISLSGDLIINTKDYNIEIPKIVSKKLSKEVKTNFDFSLSKK